MTTLLPRMVRFDGLDLRDERTERAFRQTLKESQRAPKADAYIPFFPPPPPPGDDGEGLPERPEGEGWSDWRFALTVMGAALIVSGILMLVRIAVG